MGRLDPFLVSWPRKERGARSPPGLPSQGPHPPDRVSPPAPAQEVGGGHTGTEGEDPMGGTSSSVHLLACAFSCLFISSNSYARGSFLSGSRGGG